MNLATFGAVMKFAISAENKVLEYYKTQNEEKHKSLVKQYEKRIKRLERLSRENTTEMILEPIKDFNTEEYEFNVDIDTISDIETKMANFYKKAAIKVHFLDEVAEFFEDFVEEHGENQ